MSVSVQRQRDACTDFLNRVPNPWSVTLTCKQFAENEKLTDTSLSKNVRDFLNRLNKKCLGKRFSRFGVRLSVVPVIELSYGQRLHVHLTIEQPKHLDKTTFQSAIKTSWRETKFGHWYVDQSPTLNATDWMRYTLKPTTKIGSISDSVDWNNVHLPPSTD